MTRAEWDRIVATQIATTWEHDTPSDAALDMWFADLAHCDAGEVEAAVATWRLRGERFAPHSGQILQTISELVRDDPSHDEAWALQRQAVRRFGHHRHDEAMEWLRGQSDAVALAVERFGWRELCHHDLREETTIRAQFRSCYLSIVDGRAGADRLAVTPGGSPRMRALGGSRKRGLTRPEFAAVLGGGDAS